jgi:hypothetical protein
MSNPFRVSVPNTLGSVNRTAGRSLAEVTEKQQQEQRQEQKQRNSRYYRKKKKKKSPPKPYDWTNHVPVGSTQWIEKRALENPIIPYTNYPLDNMTKEERQTYHSCIPRISKISMAPKNALSPTEIAFEQGWERHEEPITDQNGNIFRYDVFWTHPKYVPMRFASNTVEEEPKYNTGYINWYGKRYEIPITTDNEDPLGLAYNFEVTPSGNSLLVSNEWQSFWDTRRGKRYANYLDYLDGRKETRNSFIQQTKKIQKVY